LLPFPHPYEHLNRVLQLVEWWKALAFEHRGQCEAAREPQRVRYRTRGPDFARRQDCGVEDGA